MSDWTLSGICSRVVDGDTIHVQVIVPVFEDEEWRRVFDVRLLELNCAEKGTPAGDAATEYTKSLLYTPDGISKPITLKSKARRDRYGRLLAYVEVGGEDLSQAIVASGHGVKVEYSAHIAELTRGEK